MAQLKSSDFIVLGGTRQSPTEPVKRWNLLTYVFSLRNTAVKRSSQPHLRVTMPDLAVVNLHSLPLTKPPAAVRTPARTGTEAHGGAVVTGRPSQTHAGALPAGLQSPMGFLLISACSRRARTALDGAPGSPRDHGAKMTQVLRSRRSNRNTEPLRRTEELSYGLRQPLWILFAPLPAKTAKDSKDRVNAA